MKLILILSLLSGAAITSHSAEVTPTVSSATIPNFHEVSTGVYRGGQPTTEGWAFLKSKGVKTVVKLNFESEGSDKEAEALGMTVIDASGPPSELKNMFRAPKPEKIRLAIEALRDRKNRPIYIHCLHGQDRTGLVVALFRVIEEGRTKAEAYKEMRKLGFHRSLRGLHEMWESFNGKSLPGQPPSR